MISIQSQHIHILWIVNEVLNPIRIFFGDAMCVDECLYCVWIVAHLSQVVDQLNLPHHEEIVSHTHHLNHLVLHLGLNHELLLILHFLWIWPHASHLEIVSHLFRDLLQHFLSKQHWVVVHLSEGHELDDVTRDITVKSAAEERIHVTVQSHHLAEVSFTNSHDDD